MNQQCNRRKFLSLTAKSALSLALLGGLRGATEARNARSRKMNVLFIAVDDLRPTLGCYGERVVQSPNIDKLAARGMVFTRTYCQYAVCAGSRNSLLTGRRPDTIGIYDLSTNFRTALPDVVTLPQQFKENGYHVEGMGKIYHTFHGNYDDERSWSVPSWPEEMRGPMPQQATLREQTPQNKARRNGPPTGAPRVAASQLFDTKLSNHAIERLIALKANGNKPFFLAVGFLKPHLPFIAPKRYWDLYEEAQFKLEDTKDLPKYAPPYAGNNLGELRSYAGVPQKEPMPDELARHLIHGYYACVSYVDAQIGRVLDSLDQLGLRENTIVILWGDHGWHLGDHGLWAKHTAYERATHSTMIVSAPGMKAVGQKCNALTEFVDIYPSLCELASVPKTPGLEGTSFVPLMNDPQQPWKKAAFSQWPRKIPNHGIRMGHSIRTDRYRLTEWTVADEPDYSVVELYDYKIDPQETVNIAALPENARLVADLKAQLHAGWQAALPPLELAGGFRKTLI